VKQTCVFDTCDDGGATFLAATCEHDTWAVDSRICATLGCVAREDDFGCPDGNACVEKPTCSKTPGSECQRNPCSTEPFSCACAGVLCPKGTVCDSAIDGRIVCKESPRSRTDPVVLAEGLALQGPLALRAGTLYAAALTPRALVVIDAATGAMKDLGDVGMSAYDVATDADGIYWVDQARLVMSTPDGAQTVLVDAIAAQRISVDAKYVYFTTSGSDLQHPNAVERVAKSGSRPEVLATIVAPLGIAVDETGIYFGDRNNATNLGIIYRLPLNGGTPATLATEQGFPSALALTPSSVYWLDEWPPDVKLYAKSGGAPVPLYSAEAGKSTPKGIALDATSLYFTDSDTGNVMKVPAAGGSAIQLATGPSGASGVAVDDRYVYWTTPCGRVLRVEK
jgi:sugar lactone lactonase YvrE